MANISDLKFDDKNMNAHTEYGMSLLEKSLRENGAGRSILIDKDNNIIAGNGIIEAAGNIGLEDLQIVETDGSKIVAVKRTDIALDSAEGRQMALADNATAAADLEWDKGNIEEASEQFGIDPGEWISDWDKDEDTEVEEDEAPEVDESEPAKSELGKVYHLGEHRLMCGDSTDAGNVAILMNGEKTDMVFTDPPYNMGETGGGFLAQSHQNIKDRIKDLVDFEVNSIGWLAESEIQNIMIFTSKELIRDYLDLFRKWKYNILFWGKTNPSPFVNNNHLPDVEYLLYFYKSGRVFNNSLKPTSIYSRFFVSDKLAGRKDGGENMHPTMKPLELIRNEVKICSSENGTVVDLFGGSGSTLIACEQLGRKCYMMELDPKYCDVIRKRYWKFTHDGDETGWEEGTPAL